MKTLDKYNLTGKVALVTGGGSGIGAASAKTLAEAGATVLIVGRRKDKLEAVQEEIRAAGGACEILPADISTEEACKEIVDQCVARLNQLDILVNNAGSAGTAHTLWEEFDTDLFSHTMTIDFDSVFFLTKYAYPQCEKVGGGSIINISSIAAMRGTGHVVYTAAKGAIRSMTRVLARKLGPAKIRINSIYPGFIETEMTKPAADNPVFVASQMEHTP